MKVFSSESIKPKQDGHRACAWFAGLFMFAAVTNWTAFAQESLIQLGAETGGRLDNEDKQEERYGLKLTVPRGIYRVSVTKISGAYPSLSMESDSLYEPVFIDSSLFEDGPQELTLPAGEYRVGVANDSRVKVLSYKLQLSLVSEWDDAVEWEPNDETGTQQLKTDKPVKGRLVGSDEDNYLLTLGPDRPESLDVVMETTNKEALILMVMAPGNENGEEQGRCQIGRKSETGYAIRGLVLDAGQYVVNVGRAPSVGKANHASKRKQPTVYYTITVSQGKRAASTLLPDLLAFRISDRQSGVYSLKDHLSRRTLTEDDVKRQSEKHRGMVMAYDMAVNLSLVKQEFPGSFEDMKKKTVAMTEDAVGAIAASLLDDSQFRANLGAAARRMMHKDDGEAGAFGKGMTNWTVIPDQWATDVLDSAAARYLRKEVGKSHYVVSAMLVSPNGVVVASSDQPAGIWLGQEVIWKRWQDRGDQRLVSTEPAFDKDAGRWLIDTAIGVKDGSVLMGVLVFRSVIAK